MKLADALRARFDLSLQLTSSFPRLLPDANELTSNSLRSHSGSGIDIASKRGRTQNRSEREARSKRNMKDIEVKSADKL